MSNYLDHLVSRGLDPTNQVKPRLPSLFEPLPETIGVSAAFAVEDESLTTPTLEITERHPFRPQSLNSHERESQPQAQRSPLPPDPAQTLSAPVVPSPAPSQFSKRELPQPQSLSPIVSPIPSQSLHPPVRTEGQDELGSNAIAPQFHPFVLTPPQLPQPTIIEHRSESIVPAPLPAGSPTFPPEETSRQPEQRQPLQVHVSLSPPVQVHASPSSPVDAASQGSSRDSPAIRPAVTAVPPNSPVSSSIRSLKTEATASLEPVPPPMIQVTIGRIEVRATPPASIQPKPRPASPVMNLDDYLHQRGGSK